MAVGSALDEISDLASVLSAAASVTTALVAAIAYGRFVHDRRRKKRRLEAYLKDLGEPTPNRLFPVIGIMAKLGMTEAEVMDAAFRSEVIRLGENSGNTDRYPQIYLAYEAPKQRPT